MAADNHPQMLIQQQPSAQQQSQLQQTQMQQSQLHMSQLQQSQLQQSQLQQSQMQQSQLQQSQFQQSQFQHSQLQQAQLQQSQMQQSQLQQTQLQQQPQVQQQSAMQQQPQQQAVTATMSLGSSMEQSNMNVTTSVPINVATINVSQPQQMQTLQQTVNTSSGTPVQMAVPQLTAQAQTLPAGTMMSQSSGPHPTMMHPTMTMAQAPLQQVQVIQQPLAASYLQHIYSPQQQMFFPGNLTLQHTGMATPTLQSFGGQGMNIQLQPKTTLDPKASVGQSIPAVSSANKIHVIQQPLAASSYLQHLYSPQQQMLFPGNLTIQHTGMGTPTLQSFGGQGMNIQLQPKTTSEPKTSVGQSIQAVNTANKGMSANAGARMTATGQVFTASPKTNLPQQKTVEPVKSVNNQKEPVSTPGRPGQVVISQMLPSRQSILSHKRWFPDSKLYDKYMPRRKKKVQPGVQAQTVAVATQTNVSNSASVNADTVLVPTQVKPKVSLPAIPSVPVPAINTQSKIATMQTQTNQSLPQTQLPSTSRLISDAGNQAKPMDTEMKSSETQSKSESVETKLPSSPHKAMVAPSFKISPAPVICVTVATPTSTLTTFSSPTSVMTSTKVLVNSSVSTTESSMSPFHHQPSVLPVQKVESKAIATSTSTMTTVSPTTSVMNNTESLVNSLTTSSPTSTLTTVSATTSVMTNTKVFVDSSVSTTESAPPAISSISSVCPIQKEESQAEPEAREPLSVLPCKPVASVQPTEVQSRIPVDKENLKPQQPNLKHLLEQLRDLTHSQKTLGKPCVLTHVIDGFVFQESSEPFPVHRPAYLDFQCKFLPSVKPDSHQKRKDSPAVGSPEKMKLHRRGGPGRKRKMRGRGRKSLMKLMETMQVEEITICPDDESKIANKAVEENPEPTIDSHTMNADAKKDDIEVLVIDSEVSQKLPTESSMKDLSTEAMSAEKNVSTSHDKSIDSKETEEDNSEPLVDKAHPIIIDLENEEVEGWKTDSNVSQKCPTKWSVQEVYEFIRDLPSCSDYADIFKSQEIDGQALLLLKEDHLMTAMCMKLGPALKLMSQIKSMNEAVGPF